MLFGHQVVDQHADVGLVAAQDDRRAALHLQRGVDAGHQALGGGLLVAAGAVDLPGVEQALDALGLQPGADLLAGHAVVLDGVAGAHDLGLAQRRDGVEHGQLHLLGHAGEKALDIDLAGVPALRLQEELVALLVGKAHDLFLKAGAVARPGGVDGRPARWASGAGCRAPRCSVSSVV